MKGGIMYKRWIIIGGILFLLLPRMGIASVPIVGVIQSKYGHVERLLQKHKIPFTLLGYRDLEDKQIYEQYTVLFFPCGIGVPVDESIQLLARGRNLQKFSLKKDAFYHIDEDLVAEYIEQFIRKGGSAYFSDFSCTLLDKALNNVRYYNNFPHLGLQGWIQAYPQGEFAHYFTEDSLKLYQKHSGWVVPRSIEGAETILSTEADTPLGKKKAILAAVIPYHNGEAIYTGFHNESERNNLMRYLVFRTIYHRNLVTLKQYIHSWEQQTQTAIVDKSLTGENHRSYKLNVKRGRGNIYFTSTGGRWQLDLYDARGSLLYSTEGVRETFRYGYVLRSDSKFYLKIYPLSEERHYVYAAASASGMRIFPYYFRISVGAGIVFFLVIFVLVVKQKRHTGYRFLRSK
jgi:hypothetical protein